DEGWKAKKISTLADIISAPEKYRNALDSVITELGNSLVVDSIEDGERAVRDLQAGNKGNAAFICLQCVPKIRRKLPTPRDRGRDLRLVDVIECDPKYRPLFDFLLDDVVIAATLEEAKTILARNTGLRCLTLDGQLLTSSGLLKGGSSHIEGTG